ncbi:MAG: hypothetical protein ACWGSQ_04340 [Longimicrobiales bacterium]
MRTVRLLSIMALLGAAACTDVTQPKLDEGALFAMNGAARTNVVFTMAVTDFGGIFWKDLGRSSRAMVRDDEIFFEVSGDVVGTATILLNANCDEGTWWGTGPGRASAWGAVSIETAAGVWEGNLTGEFIFDPAQSDWNAQLFSKVNLHGPDGQKLKAVCNETSAESEVLACSGVILGPRG